MSETVTEIVKLKRPVDFEILEAFSDGERDVGVNIAQRLDRNRGYINTRLPQLEDYGLLQRVGPAERSGLYQITVRGVAALSIRDEYDTGPEFEDRIDERAVDIEIVRPQIVDESE